MMQAHGGACGRLRRASILHKRRDARVAPGASRSVLDQSYSVKRDRLLTVATRASASLWTPLLRDETAARAAMRLHIENARQNAVFDGG